MENWFTASPWPGLILWTLIYLSDYRMTITNARLYRASPHYTFEGSLELTAQFEKDVDALRPISRRHLWMLVLTDSILLVFWGLFDQLGYTRGFGFILGMFVLMEVGVHLRHLRSYFLLSLSQARGGMEGTLAYRRWYSFANSAFEFLTYALLFLFTGLMTGSLFFTGGAISCLSLAFNHYRRYRKLYKQAEGGQVK